MKWLYVLIASGMPALFGLIAYGLIFDWINTRRQRRERQRIETEARIKKWLEPLEGKRRA